MVLNSLDWILGMVVNNSIAIDFIIDCLTKKKYDDLTYSERLFVNDIFENATKEDLEVLKNIYFIDMKDIWRGNINSYSELKDSEIK